MNQEQIKSMLQLALGSGGPLVALLLSYGLPQDKLNLWINVVVAFGPPIVAGIWAIFDRKHKNQIAAVASIPGVESVTISPSATDGAAAAAADPKLTNVNK